MKLSLKAGEHVRITHDRSGGRFRLYLEDGLLHVSAMDDAVGITDIYSELPIRAQVSEKDPVNLRRLAIVERGDAK